MRILIVDDYQPVIDITIDLLSSKGHSTLVADFDHAMQTFLDNEIDLIMVNADPLRYDSILNLCTKAKKLSPSLPVYISSILTDDITIKTLELSGATIFYSLTIINAIINL